MHGSVKDKVSTGPRYGPQAISVTKECKLPIRFQNKCSFRFYFSVYFSLSIDKMDCRGENAYSKVCLSVRAIHIATLHIEHMFIVCNYFLFVYSFFISLSSKYISIQSTMKNAQKIIRTIYPFQKCSCCFQQACYSSIKKRSNSLLGYMVPSISSRFCTWTFSSPGSYQGWHGQRFIENE